MRLRGKATRARVLGGLVSVVALAAVPACGLTVENIPLPKPQVPGETYTVHAVFSDALNLPAQAKVKVGGSDVGIVTDITTSNFTADVEMKIRKDVALPAGSKAELRQATPLGDVFVAVAMPPKEPGQKMISDGGTIPLEQTSAGATVEELLTSVSLLINGGGVNQISKLVTQLDSMVGGRGPQISHLIVEMTNVIASLNSQTDNIDATLNGLDATLATINQNKESLGAVADALPPMIGTLAETNQQIGDLLAKIGVTSAALDDFASTTTTQLDQLLQNTTKLMNGLTQMGDSLGGTLTAVHDLKPKAMASMEGQTLAVAVTLQYLSVGALSDPLGSRVPDGSDITAFVGSLIEVLDRVQERLQGGNR
jgi:phospholipid/cholesterol/gamma-HCH transport system substrate-binding protein